MKLALDINILLVTTTLVVLFSSFVVDSDEVKDYHPEERYALLQIRDSMSSDLDLHKNWTGPPCIGNNSSIWVGVSCSNWHVISLVLEGIHLTGTLPPAFLQNITFLTNLSFRNNSVHGSLPNLTSLVNLEYVSFSHNLFSGPIPFEYTELPRLKQLELQQNYLDGEIPPFSQPTLTDFNVSYNRLHGLIPETGVLQRFPESSYDHNSNLCGIPLQPCPAPPPVSPPESKKKKKKKFPLWGVALVAAAGGVLPFVVLFVFLYYYCRRAKEKEGSKQKGEGNSSGERTDKRVSFSQSRVDPERTVELLIFEKSIPAFDLDDLLRSSAETLGNGKLGTTYKAILESGTVLAVKRLRNMNNLSRKEFIQQMKLLGKMRHENLVQIISFYYSKEEKLIMYEFVPDGSLYELLHENRGMVRTPLKWAARLSIIKDIAKGLAFLHQSLPSHKVPHANLKSSNVLIHRDNKSYHSKLTNYGFLPLLPDKQSSQELVAIGRSPEFKDGRRLNHKADVYCFGIIILEVITGRISPGNDEIASEEDLSEWVRAVVNCDWSTDILDVEILATKEGQDEMLMLTEMALECTDMEPHKRPKMSEVLRRIEEIEQRSRGND
ncbi:hypothetical protein Tsubulata_006317 [Turnera subulata]|uniref:Protein kinase domain-containing protein n=1 Tax=Turnera subulata TaxID=218843 RepID=A0A9Q0G7C3_9ROSI|nr:hypothetical protein Tsubulata_006317 [Turnera subulata]